LIKEIHLGIFVIAVILIGSQFFIWAEATYGYGDFNGDDFADLAIGVSSEDLDETNEGAVNVIYGSAKGLHKKLGHADQFWHQDKKGIANMAEDSDFFGGALAAGDFNNDGYDDLAVGVGGEDLDGINEGAVNVIYGSAKGLHKKLGHADQFWHQDKKGIEDEPETADAFGRALTTGDFNNDGYDDLAVGIPSEDLGDENEETDEGAVHVIYGSAKGLHKKLGHEDQFWHQDSSGIAGVAEENDQFGRALTTGDFNNDGYDDLAIGVLREDLASAVGSEHGAVNVIYGSAQGLHENAGNADQIWHQNSSGILGVAEDGDLFGVSLGSGDFNNDGYDDLAIGVLGEDLDGNGEGAVNVIYGSAQGLHRNAEKANQIWTQDSPGIEDEAEDFDRFGAPLGVGDFNHDTIDDLAIGVLFEDLASGVGDNHGAVNVIYGSAQGLHENAGNADQLWHQDSPGIADMAEDFDRFGIQLGSGDFNNDGYDDLAIGVSPEDLDGVSEGAVNVIYGSLQGLHKKLGHADQFWHQDKKGIADEAEDNDFFGNSLP